MIALLDAEYIAFKDTIDVENMDEARDKVVTSINNWVYFSGCKSAIVCLGGKFNFRKQIHSSYKANRTGEKPDLYYPIIKFICENYQHRIVEGLEADDILAIYGTHNPDTVVISVDKDLMGVPCNLFNPLKNDAPYRVSEGDANFWWLKQTLMGDTSDGYGGCPQIGNKKSDLALLNTDGSVEQMWVAVTRLFLNAGLTEEDAIVQARLSRILRCNEYSAKNRSISLWHPESPESLTLPW